MKILASRLTLCAVIAIAILVLSASPITACPSCKAALASQEAGQGDLVQGFFWSILFMMATPFAIIGTFSGCMYMAVRRARAQQNATQPHKTGSMASVPVNAASAAHDEAREPAQV